MIHRLPLVEMASLARSGAVSSFELVEAHLARIEDVNPHFNAFTMVLAEQVRASARLADQGLKMGALHGVPVTVKDLCQTKGVPTTCASKVLRDWRPDTNRDTGRSLRGGVGGAPRRAPCGGGVERHGGSAPRADCGRRLDR